MSLTKSFYSIIIDTSKKNPKEITENQFKCTIVAIFKKLKGKNKLERNKMK